MDGLKVYICFIYVICIEGKISETRGIRITVMTQDR